MKGLLVLLIFSLCAPTYGALYKWVDENGNTHYSDQPPVEATSDLKVLATPSIDNTLASPPQHNGFIQPEVIMYSTSWCGYCKKASQYFKSQGIAFTEKDIEVSSEARREYDQIGGRGVPVITVNGEKMQGYHQDRFDQIYQSHLSQ